jgi:hypothetical protein
LASRVLSKVPLFGVSVALAVLPPVNSPQTGGKTASATQDSDAIIRLAVAKFDQRKI